MVPKLLENFWQKHGFDKFVVMEMQHTLEQHHSSAFIDAKGDGFISCLTIIKHAQSIAWQPHMQNSRVRCLEAVKALIIVTVFTPQAASSSLTGAGADVTLVLGLWLPLHHQSMSMPLALPNGS